MRVLTTQWPTNFISSRNLSSGFFNDMDRFFEDTKFSPASEVSETDEYYLMSVDLPGLKKENIKIELNQNILSVTGERKREAAIDEKFKVHFNEKHHGLFKKSFTLPPSTDGSKVEARYEDGVLELYLPKTALAKPRQIEIKSDTKDAENFKPS